MSVDISPHVVYVSVGGVEDGRRALRRYRAVALSLLATAAAVALVSAGSRYGSEVAMAARPLGSEGAAMEQRELAALASEKSPAQMHHEQQLVVKGPHPTLLAWKNAGAVADANVFKHPDDWTAPDDPVRATVNPETSKEYSADLHPTGGLEIVHSTDNGSPVGDSFAIKRGSDDVFHGSAPSPPPPTPSDFFTMPKGETVSVVAPTENGQTSPFKEFDFDTTADDFFTHHPPAPPPPPPAARR